MLRLHRQNDPLLLRCRADPTDQPQRKRRALSRCRLHANHPAMASGDRLGDGQPQTRAPLLTAAGGIEAMEALKDQPLGLRWDTRTAVLHEQPELPPASLQTHPDYAAGRAVLQGIAEQVDQQPAQLRFHPPEQWRR